MARPQHLCILKKVKRKSVTLVTAVFFLRNSVPAFVTQFTPANNCGFVCACVLTPHIAALKAHSYWLLGERSIRSPAQTVKRASRFDLIRWRSVALGCRRDL